MCLRSVSLYVSFFSFSFSFSFSFFFFNETATTEIYTLSLHDALPIYVELVVCAPVLERSPVLTDEDLLEIMSSTPVQGALSAISKRRNLSADLSDAIYNSADEDAIGVMLGNTSAQIQIGRAHV